MARPFYAEIQINDDSGHQRRRRYRIMPGVVVDSAKLVPVGNWIISAIDELDIETDDTEDIT
jgi:hypothetical protein